MVIRFFFLTSAYADKRYPMTIITFYIGNDNIIINDDRFVIFSYALEIKINIERKKK